MRRVDAKICLGVSLALCDSIKLGEEQQVKKRILFVCMLLLGMGPAITYSSFERNYTLLKNVDIGMETSNQSYISRYLNEIVYIPKDNYNEQEVMTSLHYISRIPSPLLKEMAQKEINIKLFNGQLTDEPGFLFLKGKVPRGYELSSKVWDDVPGAGGSKTVYVKIGHSEKGQGHGSVNLELHEIAHTVDRHILHNLRHKEKFLTVWNEEKQILFPNQHYFLNYPEEYFAEVFAMYYANSFTRTYLKENAPKTARYLEEVIGGRNF
jgi:Pro-Pro endopeptidase